MTDAMEVQKSQPFTFDLGHLLCNDPNPLPSTSGPNKEEVLASTAQQCAQGLINQLLTACPIIKSTDGELQIKLPEPSTQLPREKPIPKEKEKTKWEKFAEKKGVKAKRKDGKLVYDEAKGDWVPKYGYKGKSDGNEDWLVEVDEKAERAKAREAEGGQGGAKSKKMKKR
ncbi:ribosomal biogenesis regulatory protein [Teratosphaeria nubilosa]|uniref:Ribosome biogenesis regulatory protein n=1 Tax=Teratosphaeria nubilosa TaxID=161662 RepID=A0A6G1L8Q9_9PEZI|nr:ribosomal biogenesis regulatory protein [Teratosphaeria nubilosa]